MKSLLILIAIINIFAIQVKAKTPSRIAEDIKKSTVIITGFFEEEDFVFNDKESWIGTGIIIDRNGTEYTIATNAHVVGFWDMYEGDWLSKGDSILQYWLKVRFVDDDEEIQVKKIFINNNHKDLALIKFNSTKEYPILPLQNENIKVGEMVYAMGHPNGLDFTFTNGIVSSKRKFMNRASEVYDFIQTQAAINSGNSGGPLVDENGNLVGINTMKISKEGVEGLNFAISVNELIRMIQNDELIEMPTNQKHISKWLRDQFKAFSNKNQKDDNNKVKQYTSKFKDDKIFLKIDEFNQQTNEVDKFKEFITFMSVFEEYVYVFYNGDIDDNKITLKDIGFYYDFVTTKTDNNNDKVVFMKIPIDDKFDDVKELYVHQKKMFIAVKNASGIELTKDEKRFSERYGDFD